MAKCDECAKQSSDCANREIGMNGSAQAAVKDRCGMMAFAGALGIPADERWVLRPATRLAMMPVRGGYAAVSSFEAC